MIELLVVIAIIAILAAILFPVFAKAREKSRQSACLSNCKQLGLAILQYAQDYDEMFPLTWNAHLTAGLRVPRQLAPYVKNNQIFVCPSDGVKNCDQWSGIYNDTATSPLSYSFNNNIMGDRGLGNVTMAAETPLLADGKDGIKFYGYQRWSNLKWSIAADRHNAGANFAYVDGHAKWVPAMEIQKATFFISEP